MSWGSWFGKANPAFGNGTVKLAVRRETGKEYGVKISRVYG